MQALIQDEAHVAGIALSGVWRKGERSPVASCFSRATSSSSADGLGKERPCFGNDSGLEVPQGGDVLLLRDAIRRLVDDRVAQDGHRKRSMGSKRTWRSLHGRGGEGGNCSAGGV